ncbi:MAG TPA: phosphoenolpyruvate carboxykinase (ATP), partial [Anaerolineaceae bacterium]|nr:phosphoenolpyruvate carboxykinase (ATP) [Anaerolineaceae bacterium]
MQVKGIPSEYGLEHHGLQHLKTVNWNLFPPTLVEEVIKRQEGNLAQAGSVVVTTGLHTGRSPKDKFVVQYPGTDGKQIWWGKVNQPISPDNADRIYHKMLAYLQGRDVFVQDLQVGAHPAYQVPIRVISEKAWAALFSHNLFRRIGPEQMARHIPEFVVLHCPDFLANPTEDGTNSSTFIIVDFSRRM